MNTPMGKRNSHRSGAYRAFFVALLATTCIMQPHDSHLSYASEAPRQSLVEPDAAREMDSVMEAFRRNENIDRLVLDLKGTQRKPTESKPQQVATDVILLEPSVTRTENYLGNIKVLGEVKNVGESEVCFVKITYGFYDAAGELIGTDYTYVEGSSKRLVASQTITSTVLSPDEIGAFELYTDIPNDQVSSANSSISFETYETSPPDAVIVLNGNLARAERHDGRLTVSGELKNTGDTVAYWIQLVAVVKNAAGRVLDIDFDFADGDTVVLDSGEERDAALMPGATGDVVLYTDAQYADVETIDYKINWEEGGISSILGDLNSDSKVDLVDALLSLQVSSGQAPSIDIDGDVNGDGKVDIRETVFILRDISKAACTDADSDGYFLESECGLHADCDDTDPSIHPGASEICGDGIDQNCDETDQSCSSDDVDDDGDGYTENQGDCNDGDVSIHPAAVETCDDGIDNDCDEKPDCADSACSDHESCQIDCTLTCTEDGFGYSCASGSATSQSEFCILHGQAALTAITYTYSNGRTVTCDYVCGTTDHTCQDDTGASCTYPPE